MDGLDLVVFDIAGTTVQLTDELSAAFKVAFDRAGVTLSDGDIRWVRGRSKGEAISGLLASHLGAADARRLAADVQGEFRRILLEGFEERGVEPIGGAEETFEWLRARDVKVALSTGLGRDLTDAVLRAAGWDASMDAVVCNEDVPRGRPAPYLIFRAMELTGCESVHRVAAVGDTVSDLGSAHNAGVRWGIGVLTGAHSEDQLRSCPHTHIIASVKELPSVFG